MTTDVHILTRVHPLSRLGTDLEINLWAKSNYLFSYVRGGNKARKLVTLLLEIEHDRSSPPGAFNRIMVGWLGSWLQTGGGALASGFMATQLRPTSSYWIQPIPGKASPALWIPFGAVKPHRAHGSYSGIRVD